MDESDSVGPRTNVVLSLLILAGCGLGWLATDSLPAGLRVDPLGPAYYPRFVLLSLAGLALALLAASLRDLRAGRSPVEPSTVPDPALVPGAIAAPGVATEAVADAIDDEPLPPISYPRMLAVFVLALAYVLLLVPLGYLVSTILFVAVLLPLLRVRRPLTVAACALGTPLVLGGIFGFVLGIPLPDGILEYLPLELP